MKTLDAPLPTADAGEFETDVALDDMAFRNFAERLASGENAAATELLNCFSARLISLARGRLSPQVTAKSDPEDVVQSVMRTFFRRVGTREIELRDWPSLWGLLSLLTIRKCAMRGREFATARRNVKLEVSLAGTECQEFSVPGREPTPLEVATFVDLLEHLLASVSAEDRKVIEGLIAGRSVAELANQLGTVQRTIYRTTARLRQTLLRSS